MYVLPLDCTSFGLHLGVFYTNALQVTCQSVGLRLAAGGSVKANVLLSFNVNYKRVRH